MHVLASLKLASLVFRLPFYVYAIWFNAVCGRKTVALAVATAIASARFEFRQQKAAGNPRNAFQATFA